VETGGRLASASRPNEREVSDPGREPRQDLGDDGVDDFARRRFERAAPGNGDHVDVALNTRHGRLYPIFEPGGQRLDLRLHRGRFRRGRCDDTGRLGRHNRLYHCL